MQPTPSPLQSVIELREAKIQINPEKTVLENVNLNIVNGEFVYLIGKTGSGKSSLFRTLYADLAWAGGYGRVAGYELSTLTRKDVPFLRRKLGIVFQDFNLMTDRTVEDNLFFVMEATGWTDKKAMLERATETMAKVGLESKLKSMPHQLSGGEQQRVGIARALVNRPEIILADEPTGNLDPDTSNEVMLTFRKISRELNTAVFIATHDFQVIETFPARIVRIANNTLLDDGLADY